MRQLIVGVLLAGVLVMDGGTSTAAGGRGIHRLEAEVLRLRIRVAELQDGYFRTGNGGQGLLLVPCKEGEQAVWGPVARIDSRLVRSLTC